MEPGKHLRRKMIERKEKETAVGIEKVPATVV
jgi:hypothetical protein